MSSVRRAAAAQRRDRRDGSIGQPTNVDRFSDYTTIKPSATLLRASPSDLQTQLSKAGTAANQLHSGNTAAAHALVDDLGTETGSIVAPLTDLQQVSLTDLAIATLETKACRQLSGIPI